MKTYQIILMLAFSLSSLPVSAQVYADYANEESRINAEYFNLTRQYKAVSRKEATLVNLLESIAKDGNKYERAAAINVVINNEGYLKETPVNFLLTSSESANVNVAMRAGQALLLKNNQKGASVLRNIVESEYARDLPPKIRTMTTMRFPINLCLRRSQHEEETL